MVNNRKLAKPIYKINKYERDTKIIRNVFVWVRLRGGRENCIYVGGCLPLTYESRRKRKGGRAETKSDKGKKWKCHQRERQSRESKEARVKWEAERHQDNTSVIPRLAGCITLAIISSFYSPLPAAFTPLLTSLLLLRLIFFFFFFFFFFFIIILSVNVYF